MRISMHFLLFVFKYRFFKSLFVFNWIEMNIVVLRSKPHSRILALWNTLNVPSLVQWDPATALTRIHGAVVSNQSQALSLFAHSGCPLTTAKSRKLRWLRVVRASSRKSWGDHLDVNVAICAGVTTVPASQRAPLSTGTRQCRTCRPASREKEKYSCWCTDLMQKIVFEVVWVEESNTTNKNK